MTQAAPFVLHGGHTGLSYAAEACVVCHQNAASGKAGFCVRCDGLYGTVAWSQVGNNHRRKVVAK